MQPRPAGVLMIAIFLFAVTGLMAIGTVSELLYLAPSAGTRSNPVLVIAVVVVLVGVMVAGGIGLLFAKPWARWSCIVLFGLLTFGGLIRVLTAIVHPGSMGMSAYHMGTIIGQLIVYVAFTLPWIYLAFHGASKAYFAPPQSLSDSVPPQ